MNKPPHTVLLLHAYPLSAAMWQQQQAALAAAGLQVIAPNLPGFGGTQGSIESLPELATQLLHDLPTEPLSVVGLSMGGYIALELLAQAPARFGRVVLANTTLRADSPDKQQDRHEQAERVLAEGQGFIVEAAEKEHSRSTYQQVRPMIEAASPQGIAAALRAMAARSEQRSTLQALQLPLLVIAGSEDSITTPEMAQEIADAGRGELHMIQQAAHLSNLDQPEAFNQVLLNFLAMQTMQGS